VCFVTEYDLLDMSVAWRIGITALVMQCIDTVKHHSRFTTTIKFLLILP